MSWRKAPAGNRVLEWLGYEQHPSILMYHSRGEKVNHNCEVFRERNDHTEKVTCRHLALAYARGSIGRSKVKFSEIDTRERIRESSSVPDDLDWRENFADSGCSSDALYFNIDELPDAMYSVASELHEQDEKNYLFMSSDHVMVLRFTRSKDNGIVIYFYDPNDTLRHKKIRPCTPEDLKSLTSEDLLDEGYKQELFPCGLEAGLSVKP